jgi:PKD repeat protein
VSRLVVQVNERYSIPVTFEPNVSTGGVVRFTANAAPRTNSTIVRYEWDFGDGNYTVTTGNIITHRYTSSRTYLVRLWVTASNGDSGYAENDVRVTF